MILKIKRLSDDVVLPKYEHNGDSGMDLRVYKLESSKSFIKDCAFYELMPFETIKCLTSIACEIESGYEIQIRPRSGISIQGILTHFGTIDSNYRGEIGIIITNLSPDIFTIRKGDRIAQAVLMKIEKAEIEDVKILSETDRGSNGFGSTGVK